MTVKKMRRPTAAPAPRMMPQKRCCGRQPSAGQRDDDGIVAGEQDADPDDLKNLDTKRPVFPESCENN